MLLCLRTGRRRWSAFVRVCSTPPAMRHNTWKRPRWVTEKIQHVWRTGERWPAIEVRKCLGHRCSYLSWHKCRWWLLSWWRGRRWLHRWHSAGISEAAFSTAKLRTQLFLLISQRQLGQVAVSSLIRASANKWLKQAAHMRCPLQHWKPMGEKGHTVYCCPCCVQCMCNSSLNEWIKHRWHFFSLKMS